MMNVVAHRYGLPGRLREHVGSLPSRCERSGFALLALVCVSVIFSTAIVQSLVVGLALVVIGCRFIDQAPPIRHTPLDVPYLVFLLARVASIAFSRYPSLSVRALYLEYFFYLMFFFVTQTVRRDEVPAAQLLTSLLVAAGVAAGAIGMMKVLVFSAARGSSTTAGTYTLGAFLCPVLALALLPSLQRPNGEGGRLHLLPPLFICLGIISTFDRLHWIGMALVLAAGIVVSRNRARSIAICLPLLLAAFLPSVRFRIEQTTDIGAFMAGRDVLWRGASLLLGEHPLVGFGPRTFSAIFPLFDEMPVRGVGSWHNDFLQVYMDSGLLGLLPLMWLIGATYFQGIRLIRSPSLLPHIRGLALSLLLSMGAIILLGGMIDTHVGIVFRILLGLLAVLLTPSPDVVHAHPASEEKRVGQSIT